MISAPTLFSAMHGSLVTSSLIRETTENESANEGYRFGQEELEGSSRGK
jgi:photosystem II P680 reaction center D1 protein